MQLFRRTNRKALRSRRGEERSTLRHILYGVGLILAILAVGSLTWYVTRLPHVTISEIDVRGGETIAHEVVRTKIAEILRDDYVLVIPYTFAYLYPHDTLIDAVKKIPRVKNVTIERTSSTKLVVTFDEYIPYALWCVDDPGTASCYFLDREGYSFTAAPALQGGVLRRHVLEDRSELTTGQVLDSDALAEMDTFANRIEKELLLRIGKIIHTKEGDLHYAISGGGSIYVAADQDVDTLFENLATVLASKEFFHLEPGNFKYIDLRFGNKVFVNESKEEVGTSTEEVIHE